MSLESIKYIPLRDAVIEMQNSNKYNYYGFFALYFNFVEDEKLPAAAGVSIRNKKFVFHYSPSLLEDYKNKYGKEFFHFLVTHEVQHILLNHIFRTGERNHQISNIAQDMLINQGIKDEFSFDYNDFYYADKKYPFYDPKKYKGPMFFEPLYDYIFQDLESQTKPNQLGQGQSQPGQGKGQLGGGVLVDVHFENDLTENEITEIEYMTKEIHDSLKARGLHGTAGIEKIFQIKRKKNIVNVFKRIFTNSSLKDPTYKKLSRRYDMLKGKKKTGKDINLIVDTSGSLYDELDQYMGGIVGNYNIYLIQIDTEVTFEGNLKSLSQWKKVTKKGGGGTTLQPAIDLLVKMKRQHIPTYFVSDFYCDELDFQGFTSQVTLIKSKDSTDPVIKNCRKIKIVS